MAREISLGLKQKGQVHLCCTYHATTHMQPMKLMMLGNKVLPLHSGAKYKWIYRTYIAVTGDNMVLTMGEILVKKDFSGTADATPQHRTDFSSRLV